MLLSRAFWAWPSVLRSCAFRPCANRTAFVSPLPHCHLCGYGSSSGPTEGLSFCWPSPPPQQLSYEWVNCKTDLSKTSCSPTNMWSHRKSGPTTAIIAKNSIESGDGLLIVSNKILWCQECAMLLFMAIYQRIKLNFSPKTKAFSRTNT